jgi:hypothetical protein
LSEWQPIESAPKDGTSILMRGPYRMVVTFWGDLNPPDLMDPRPHHSEMAWLTDWDCKNGPAFLRLDYLNPTHWMPLPRPPIEEGRI